jgi:hypothetical protein
MRGHEILDKYERTEGKVKEEKEFVRVEKRFDRR